MDQQTNLERGLIKEKGGTWEIPLAPMDEVQIAVNNVIAKTITADNFTTLQIKTWQTITRK